jgi:hypothetical protein
MDVTKCFDSIYTHSIAWATKNKLFSKDNPKITSFGNAFDTLMQKSNFNETNGIPIGSEASRIFAEVIFQDIDFKSEIDLSKDFNFEQDYQIARYVDDIFIFARNIGIAKKVQEKYIEHLNSYNLHVNHKKTDVLSRPFFTEKSKLIRDTNTCINDFVNRFICDDSPRDKPQLKKIFNRSKLMRSFIDSVKASCKANSSSYDDVGPYIISSLLERTKLLTNQENFKRSSNKEFYYDALMTVLDTSFFFYNAAPAVASSYKLGQTIIHIARFSRRNLPSDAPSVAQLIHDRCNTLFNGILEGNSVTASNFVFLEAINVALATNNLGPDFMLSTDKIRRIFLGSPDLGYFHIVSLIFYCRDNPRYQEVNRDVVEAADRMLSDLTQVQHDSSMAHLFLDAISCPYIDIKKRHKWLKRFFRAMKAPAPASGDAIAYLRSAEKAPWFINWEEMDLLNPLERKELKQVYA